MDLAPNNGLDHFNRFQPETPEPGETIERITQRCLLSSLFALHSLTPNISRYLLLILCLTLPLFSSNSVRPILDGSLNSTLVSGSLGTGAVPTDC